MKESINITVDANQKKKLTEDEATHPDVSFRKSIWRSFEED